jgi:hypothetical protein
LGVPTQRRLALCRQHFRTFPTFLQGRREVQTATVTSGGLNVN